MESNKYKCASINTIVEVSESAVEMQYEETRAAEPNLQTPWASMKQLLVMLRI